MAWATWALFAVAAYALAGCGGGGEASAPARIAVLSAFPAELAAVLAHVTVDETVDVGGRNVRVGTLAGRPVVVAMTGIGLVNAAATTRAILERFPIRGVVVSGVAGSPLRIADVAAPARWSLPDGRAFAADPRWLRRAQRLADGADLRFERCLAGVCPSADPACFQPVLVVGGDGVSEDPFGGAAFPCHPGAGDIFGCDAAATTAGAVSPVIQDMETAAIAAETAARRLPFIAFRGVSDGAGDPCDLPPFPGQFYAYYRLAAANAAAVAAAFVGES
ncbi:MAG: hypothetical protein U0802_20125 [Candidatus Binatia bacterium]